MHQKRASQVLIFQKNVQKRAKTCKKTCISSTYASKTCISSTHLSKQCAKTCKNVHHKYFWTQFKNVHLQGPCSLRPCCSRPYCNELTNCFVLSCFCFLFLEVKITIVIQMYKKNTDPGIHDLTISWLPFGSKNQEIRGTPVHKYLCKQALLWNNPL